MRRASVIHFEAATLFKRRHFAIGIVLAVLSSLVGTSVFAALDSNTNLYVRLAVGIVSVVAAILAGVQTFLRDLESSEKHRAAAARFSALKREIEQRMAAPNTDGAGLNTFLDSIRTKWDSLTKESPTVPQRVWDGFKRRNRIEKLTFDSYGSAEPCAAPNGGPVAPVENSKATDRPPSVS